ncbi:MAG: hypothetical protein H6659_18675 [Ardenticatenaceae bacterium]|nr:hypothetical protein [Ardenticatenaceae bacterium]
MTPPAPLREALSDYSLTNIPPDLAELAQQAAVIRLHLFVMAEVQKALVKVADAAHSTLRSSPPDDPPSPAVVAQLQTAVSRAWDEFIQSYTNIVGIALQQASSFSFGVLAIMHEEWIRPVANEVQESRLFREQLNADVLFRPQLQAIVDAAYRRTWEDGLNLSNRIWQLDRYGRNGLNDAINLALARGAGAWELAQDVEQFLGPDRDCPRWARERLRDLTKADIAAGDRTGLYTGDDCRGQGVSYNALRLARTEIQAILNMATVEMFRSMPWIEKEQINLSPEHAVVDECDDLANGGEDNDGVYLVGVVFLPAHPHCLCYRTAVLANKEQFVGQLRGWMSGAQNWPQMDAYAAMLGGRDNLGNDLRGSQIGLSMAYWLWGDAVELGGLFWNMALR